MPSRTSHVALVAAVVLASVVSPLLVGGAEATLTTAPSETRTESRVLAADESIAVEVYSGPRIDWQSLDTSRAIRDAMASGRLNRASDVAVGDPIVLAIDHENLSESLSDGDATAQFFDRVLGTDASLRIEQTNPTPQRRAKTVQLDRNTTRVLSDPANEAVYVVVDTRRVSVYFGRASEADGDDRTEFRREDQFVANLTMPAGSNLTADGRTRAGESQFVVRVRKARLTMDDELADRIYVEPTSNQRIQGITNVEVGQNVTIVVHPDDADGTIESIRRTVPVQPGEDGEHRFAATFDFDDAATNATASIDIAFDGRSIAESNASLIVAAPEADVVVRSVRDNGSFARVETDAALSRGGFVVLHRENASGQVLGVSRYISRGRHENVSVYVGYPVSQSGRLVAVAHRDPNHNRWFDGPSIDGQYGTDGTATAATDYVLTPQEPVDVTTATPPGKSTRSSPDSTTTSRTTVPSETTTGTPTADTATTSQPGFGGVEAVASLVTILAGIALLRGRRKA